MLRRIHAKLGIETTMATAQRGSSALAPQVLGLGTGKQGMGFDISHVRSPTISDKRYHPMELSCWFVEMFSFVCTCVAIRKQAKSGAEACSPAGSRTTSLTPLVATHITHRIEKLPPVPSLGLASLQVP